MADGKGLKKVLSFLGKKAPKLVGKIGEIGLDAVTGGTFSKVKDLITGSDELSEKDQALALMELQQDHEAYLAELKDRQDARAMNVEAMKSDDTFIRRFPAYLAIGLVFLVFLLCAGLIFVEIPEANRPVIFSIIGSLTAVVAAIGGFYYGSSSGSKEKSGQLSQLISGIKK